MPTATAAARPAQARTLLVVDANEALLSTTRSLLADSPWLCHTCRDTLSALCALVELQADAVFVDSDASPLDGWSFCSLVKEHEQYRHTRIILLGRQDNVVLHARARAAGAEAWLPKPFSSEEALALLATDGVRA